MQRLFLLAPLRFDDAAFRFMVRVCGITRSLLFRAHGVVFCIGLFNKEVASLSAGFLVLSIHGLENDFWRVRRLVWIMISPGLGSGGEEEVRWCSCSHLQVSCSLVMKVEGSVAGEQGCGMKLVVKRAWIVRP